MSVESFVSAAEAEVDALHSLVVVRGGVTVAEVDWHPYRLDRPHRLFSLSKSFTSTAVGLAVGEGRLTVDDPVAGFFPGVGHESGMRVRDLLTMTTGHAADTAPVMSVGPDWASGFLRLPVEHPPGTHFLYNSGATYMLAAIVRRVTGGSLLDYLRPRLFEPLGFGPADWETCPSGLEVGGWGLSLAATDVARFGTLLLQDGVWEGKRLLPEGWVAEATARQVRNDADPLATADWRQGYGYQFWRCRHDAYRGDGAFGQFCVVVPGRSLVVVATAGVPEMQPVLDLVWEHLLDDASPPVGRVARRLPPVTGAASGAGGRFTVPKPRRVRPEDWRPSHEQPPTIRAIGFAELPGGDGWRVTIEDADGVHEHRCPPGDWHVSGPVASTGAWTSPGEFTLRVAYVETPFVRTYVCRFDGDALTIAPGDNVSFGPTGYAPVFAVREVS